MKILYIEADMGAAGDMLTAALLEAAPERARERIENLGIPGVKSEIVHDSKQGVGGTHVHVYVNGHEEEAGYAPGEHHHHDHDHTEHEHDHHHRAEHEHDHHHHEHHGVADIEAVINGLDISAAVRDRAKAVYGRIAAAESKVHGEPADRIHFHEVGALDAVADVVSVCLLMDMIKPDRVIVSPVNAGNGSVQCAHGILPIPAPATAEILKGIPFYKDPDIKSELTTPTGAALLAEFADEFGPMPVMTVEKTGIGTGTKDFPKANIIRVFYGEAFDRSADKPDGLSHDSSADASGLAGETADETPETICELSANIDDMTGEELGFAMDQLLKRGALDVYQTPILMKKGRPAVKLSCICRPAEAELFGRLIFQYTTTAGIRGAVMKRFILDRSVDDEKDGVRIKNYSGWGMSRSKYEYDDLAAKAEKEGLSLAEMKRRLDKK